MWTLVILIVGTIPPKGVVLTGFPTEAECIAAAQDYCAIDRRFRCKCERQ